MKYLIGIDNGGTFSKAAVFDESGKQISVASVSIPIIAPKPGFTERDMQVLADANMQAVRQAVEKAAINPADVAGIGLSGHGKGLYLLGKNREIIYNGIVSTDNRAVDIACGYKDSGAWAKAYDKVKQNVMACQPVCLLKWFKENHPQVYDAIGYVLSVKDYIRYCLTGNLNTEYTDLSGTCMMNLDTKKTDRELFCLWGIEECFDKVPPTIESCSVGGYLTEQAAEKCGLKAGTPVSAGMFDIDACGLGMGLKSPEQLVMIAGTWSINEYLSPTTVTNGVVAMNSRSFHRDYYLIEECSPTSAGNLEWCLNHVFGGLDYKTADAEVASVPIGADGVYYLPYVFGSNVDPYAKGGWLGLTSYHNRAHMLRSLYEGVAFAHKIHYDRLLSARSKPKTILAAGGAFSAPVWAQIFADVMGCDLEITEVKELGCFGAALSVGIACGLYDSLETAVEKAKTTGIVPFNPNAHEVYEGVYRKYLGMVEALNGHWNG